MKNLAIFTPKLGEPSETFIRRHIDQLAPDSTCVLTHFVLPASERAWFPRSEVHVTGDLSLIQPATAITLGARVKRKLLRRTREGKILSFLESHFTDVVLGQYLHQSWFLIRLLQDSGVRMFAHAHGYDLSSIWQNSVWKERYRDYRYCAGVIVVNQIMRQRLLSIGIEDDRIHVIPYGVAIGPRPQVAPLPEPLRLVAVGRLVGKKAPMKTLESFRRAYRERPDIKLDLVGDGPLMPELQAFLHQNGLSQSVTLHGALPHPEVKALLEGASCFIQHSIVDPDTFDEEGVPVAILEAMAVGLPVISTFHTGIPEAVSDGRTGILVPEGDVDAMATAIVTMADNLDLRQQMGLAGWERARTRFSWEREKADLMSVLFA